MDLEKTLKKYETGEVDLGALKQELKAHRDELAKSLADAGVKVTAKTEERADRLAAAGLWMKDVYLFRKNDHRSMAAAERLAKWSFGKAALAEGTGNTGGYMVPDELQADLFENIETVSVAMQGATIYVMNTDKKTVPSTTTQASAAFHKEAEAMTESEPVFGEITLNAVRLDGWSKVSNELLEDSSLSVAAILLNHFTASAGQAVDSAVFNSNESAAFSGIFTSAGAGYSCVLGTGSSTFASLVSSSIIELYAKFPTAITRRGGGKLIMSPTVWSYLAKQQMNSTYLLNPWVTRGPQQFYDLSVVLSDQAPSETAVSTGFVSIAYPRNLIVGNRRAMSVMIDPYTLGDYNQSRFICYNRIALAMGSTSGFGRIVTAAE